MSKTSLAAYPFLLGFDQVERLAERAARDEGYPPYNVEQTAPDSFRISLAVAGFTENSLGVTLEGRQLIIRGRNNAGEAHADNGRKFLHRGIAARSFQRSFVLAEGVEVTGACLENGLLHVTLHRQPPDDIVQTIPISRR